MAGNMDLFDLVAYDDAPDHHDTALTKKQVLLCAGKGWKPSDLPATFDSVESRQDFVQAVIDGANDLPQKPINGALLEGLEVTNNAMPQDAPRDAVFKKAKQVFGGMHADTLARLVLLFDYDYQQLADRRPSRRDAERVLARLEAEANKASHATKQ